MSPEKKSGNVILPHQQQNLPGQNHEDKNRTNTLGSPLSFSGRDWITLQELYLAEKSRKELKILKENFVLEKSNNIKFSKIVGSTPPTPSLEKSSRRSLAHTHLKLGGMLLAGIVLILALLSLLPQYTSSGILQNDSLFGTKQTLLPHFRNGITPTLTGLTILSPETERTSRTLSGKVVIENVQTIINTTNADGLVAYGSLNNASARTRGWNSSTNNFDVTDYHSEGVGANTSADVVGLMLKSNHERDEFVLMTLDRTNDINVQIYNSSHQWSNLLELTATSVILGNRLDLAFEDLSGDALIVWDNLTADDQISYRIWDGSSYTAEMRTNDTLLSNSVNVLRLIPRIGTDQIMMIYITNGDDIGALLWNGTDFDGVRNLTATLTSSAVRPAPAVSFSWERSGDGLLVYGDGDNTSLPGEANNLTYRTYSATAPYWSSPTTITHTDIDSVRTCSHPEHDYIGIIYQNSSDAINATMWNGTNIIGPFLIADQIAEPSSNVPNSDCVWINSTEALFGYVQLNAFSVNKFNFSTGTNAWSIANILSDTTGFSFASDDISFLQFIKHPVTSEVMTLAQDIASDATATRWNGTEFVSITTSPLTVSLETTGGEQSLSFDWYRFDPLPNVTNVSPAGLSFNTGSTVNINASVYDNIAISTVIANITHPNGSVTQLTLTDGDGDKNFTATFISTNTGSYTITIIANDTSTHKNVNSTQTGSFTLNAAGGDTNPPNVTNLAPALNSMFNFSQDLELGVNLTDPSPISTVSVNITFSNSSMHTINLANSTGHNFRFNTTYTTPFRAGVYTFRFFANDSGNNVNHSEITNFTVDYNFTRLFNGTNNYSSGFVGGTRINIFINGSDNSLHPDNKAAAGFFLSQIFDAQLIVNWSGITWVNSSNFTGAKLNFSVRSCDDTACSGETFTDLLDLSPQQIALPSNQYFQYNVSIEPDANQNTYHLYNVSLNYTTTILPTIPVNITPTKESHITNRTPTFIWTNSTDANGDVISYHLQVDDNSAFNNPEINVSAIPPDAGKQNTTYYSTTILNVDTTYYWRVRANDSSGFGDFSSTSNFTIDSLLAFSFITSSVEFGTLEQGGSENTTDGSPSPIRAENTGNILQNISINATSYFSMVSLNTSSYQYKITANESGAFNSSQSTTTWANMSKDIYRTDIAELNWRNAFNDFLMDVNVTVPTDEPAGLKSSNISFSITASNFG